MPDTYGGFTGGDWDCYYCGSENKLSSWPICIECGTDNAIPMEMFEEDKELCQQPI